MGEVDHAGTYHAALVRSEQLVADLRAEVAALKAEREETIRLAIANTDDLRLRLDEAVAVLSDSLPVLPVALMRRAREIVEREKNR